LIYRGQWPGFTAGSGPDIQGAVAQIYRGQWPRFTDLDE
jgi:hypothetical protein